MVDVPPVRKFPAGPSSDMATAALVADGYVVKYDASRGYHWTPWTVIGRGKTQHLTLKELVELGDESRKKQGLPPISSRPTTPPPKPKRKAKRK